MLIKYAKDIAEIFLFLYIYKFFSSIHTLVMCSVSTNGERASLENLKLTIGSLLECSLFVKSLVDRLS